MENYQLVLIGAWLYAVHLGQVYDYNWETETVGVYLGVYDPNTFEIIVLGPSQPEEVHLTLDQNQNQEHSGSGLSQQDQGLSMYDPNYIAWWTAQQGQGAALDSGV
jgi:hypothetical protein